MNGTGVCVYVYIPLCVPKAHFDSSLFSCSSGKVFCLTEVHHGNVKLMIVQRKTKLKLLVEVNFVVRLAYVRFVLKLGPHGMFGHKNDTRGKKILVAPFGVLHAEPFEEPLGTLFNGESGMPHEDIQNSSQL